MLPINKITITDVKYCAIWDLKTEVAINQLFKKIKQEPFNSPQRKQLVNLYLEILERKYEDKTSIEKRLCPIEVGKAEDIVTNAGIRQIGLWATGQSYQIFDRIVAGDGTQIALFGDAALQSEKARVNVITGTGFLDNYDNGWTISAGFPRGTVSFTVSEVGTVNSSNVMSDRSVFPVANRKIHEQNEDSFTITNIYVLTSI